MFSFTPALVAQVFLVLVTPVALYVAWTDLKFMKIPNRSVIIILAIFTIAGFLMIPFEFWAWRWVNFVVVLAIGFFLNAFAGVGAGDAKLAAAMAPFFRAQDLAIALPLFAAFLLGAFAAHRLCKHIPAVRRRTPDWISWERPDFPMGLALVGTFLTYLALVAFPSFYAAVASIRM